MSNLSQIQNLVKTLRKKFRNSNNIEEIKQFLAQYEWDKDLSHSYYNIFKRYCTGTSCSTSYSTSKSK